MIFVITKGIIRMSFPPNPVYPYAIDSDKTLFMVYNTSETITSVNNDPWSRELSIVPVEMGENEIWPSNGFANISGEMFYYDSVVKNSNGKIIKFTGCARNLGGSKTQYNAAGTWVRGFVVAEHHNQIAQTIINIEDFLFDINDDLQQLVSEPTCQDDSDCPEAILQFNPGSPLDACVGIVAEFNLIINGSFNSFNIDFGDGTSTNSAQTGTHTYAPGANIDPIVTVSNGKCQIVQTAISRTNPDEPSAPAPTSPFTVPIPVLPNIPTITVPLSVLPPPNLTFPPITLPYINFSPFGGINGLDVPSIILVEPGIPSLIEFSPVSIPSNITFSEAPSFSPIEFGPAPSFSPIEFGPAPSFSPIEFGPAPSFSPIEFGPAPSFSPIEFGPAPTFGPIEFGPAPTFGPIEFGPIQIPSSIIIEGNIPDTIVVIGDIPTNITVTGSIPNSITINGSIPNSITINGNIPNTITIDGNIPNSITIDGNIPNTITITGDIPNSIAITGDIPNTITIVGDIPNTITVVGGDIPTTITIVGGDIPNTITIVGDIPNSITLVGTVPNTINVIDTIPNAIVLVGNVPDVITLIGSVPDTVTLIGSIPDTITVTSSIPDTITVIDSIPNAIVVVSDIPATIAVVSDIPTEIFLVGDIPTVITVDGIPSSITVSGIPSSITVDWNGPTSITCNCTVTVSCPTSSSNSLRNSAIASSSKNEYAQFLDDSFGSSMSLTSNDLGIPSEIRLLVPEIPNISIIHDLPSVIHVDMPKIPEIITILGPLVPIPTEIRIVGAEAIPQRIELVSSLPSVIILQSEKIPSSILIEAPENLSILLDASQMPTSIHVVGMPSVIEIIGNIPKTIALSLDENLKIPMVYSGGPIPLKFDFTTPTGDNGEDYPCFSFVPCGKK
jgi:hypothetical protein